jgi:hypothetical protein
MRHKWPQKVMRFCRDDRERLLTNPGFRDAIVLALHLATVHFRLVLSPRHCAHVQMNIGSQKPRDRRGWNRIAMFSQSHRRLVSACPDRYFPLPEGKDEGFD